MSTPTQTPADDYFEPWDPQDDDWNDLIIDRTGHVVAEIHDGRTRETRDRIIACVNAFGGVVAPAAYIAKLRDENAAMRAVLANASSLLAAFLGFHSTDLPLDAVRGLSGVVKDIQPLIKL